MVATTELVTIPASELASLHEKLDAVTLMLEEQRKQQRAFQELQDDMMPVVNHGIKLAIDELAEIGMDFQVEDLLYLLKRMLRNTTLIHKMMDQLESVSALSDEVGILGTQMFNTAVHQLDELEREGYFTFARGGWNILEQIVSEFGEEDIKALGDNIVTILKTVRSMTQPEVMGLANNLAVAVQEEQVDQNISVIALAREFSDPKVRRGLARLLNVVKVMADDPPKASVN